MFIFFLFLNACSSSGTNDIEKMKEAAFNNSNLYYPNIHFGMTKMELIKALGQPVDKYSIEGIGYLKYEKGAFGFNGYIDYVEADGKIIAFDYFINTKYQDIVNLMGTSGELYPFLDYGTFILEYKDKGFIFDFWPANNAEVDQKLIGIDKRADEMKFMKIINENIDSFRFNVLTIYKN